MSDQNNLEPVIEKFTLTPEDRKRMVRLDKSILGQLNAIAPSFVQIASKAAQWRQGEVYRVIMPAGKALAISRNNPDLYRPIYFGSGGKIDGMSELEKISPTGPLDPNIISAVMGIVSFVVGQYYIHQINGRLENIEEDVAAIRRSQEAEFQSELDHIFDRLDDIATELPRIVPNTERRHQEIARVQKMQDDCIQHIRQLQRESSLPSFPSKPDDAVKSLRKALKLWYDLGAHIRALYVTSVFEYWLQKGDRTEDDCMRVYHKQSDVVEQIREEIRSWYGREVVPHTPSIIASERIRVELQVMQETSAELLQKHPWLIVPLAPGYSAANLGYSIVGAVTGVNLAECAPYVRTLDAECDKDKVEPNFECLDLHIFEKDMTIVAEDGELYYLPAE